jgi:non-specific protein-tyrosine kinase
MEDQRNIRRYLSLICRWWWLVIGCAILGAASAYIVSSQIEPVYKASTTLLVQPALTTKNSSDLNAMRASAELAQTYVKMITGRPVLKAIKSNLDLNETEGLKKRIKAELIQGTLLIRLSVEDSDPSRAALLANTIAEEFIIQNRTLQQSRYADYLSSLQEQMNDLTLSIKETQAAISSLGTPSTEEDQAELVRLKASLSSYQTSYTSQLKSYEEARLSATQTTDTLTIFEEALKPQNPIRPHKETNAAIASGIGATLAIVIVFLLEYLDDTLKTSDDVNQALGLSTLGTIGKLNKGAEELVTAVEPLSPISEAFRSLRTNIRFSSVDEPIRTLLVTSAGPTEGKSTTAANLAVVMAQAGLKVIIVDADLRRPRLDQVFGLHPRGGLTGSLLEGDMNGHLQPSKIEGLMVLPAGKRPPNPSELLGSRRLKELLGELVQQVDVVIIDSPPILPVTDAAILAQVVDGVLLVVNASETRRDVTRQAAENLKQVDANMIGVVLNKVTTHSGHYYYHEYYGNGHKKVQS